MSVKYNFIGTNEKVTYFKSSWVSAQTRKTITKVFGHDFAGGETLTAKAGAKLISDRMASNGNSANVHWIVDANDVYAVIPESQSAYATGVASYNQCSLNIEIAPSFTKGTETAFSSTANRENYYKAWKNMCRLMADICVKYDLSTNDIMQHRDVRSTSCPYTMNVYFGGYDKALSATKTQVAKEIDNLKGGSVSKPKSGESKFKSSARITDCKYREGVKNWYYRHFKSALVTTPVYKVKDNKQSGTIKIGESQIAYYAGTRNGRKIAKFFSNSEWHYFYYEVK